MERPANLSEAIIRAQTVSHCNSSLATEGSHTLNVKASCVISKTIRKETKPLLLGAQNRFIGNRQQCRYNARSGTVK